MGDDERIGVCNLPEEIRGYAGTVDYDPGTDAFLSDLEKLHIIKTLSKDEWQ